jgi:CheY-like chemotaxis protein
VLLAVRHPRIREILARHLNAAGFATSAAGSAGEAWDDYRKQLTDGAPPAVAIVDQHLPDHDGTWLAAQIRGLASPPAALILLRQLSDTGTEMERTLFDRVINKPAKPDLLIGAIGQLTLRSAAVPAGMPVERPAMALEPGLRVLLADDNAVNQKVATHMLRKFGAHVHCVGNGLEALQALRDADFDVVLMDCQMPEMDGFEATRQLRTTAGAVRNPHVPVIALTANALSSDRELCLAAGMNDYLSKPVDRHRLEAALRRAVPRGERSGAPAAAPAPPPPATAQPRMTVAQGGKA